MDADRPRAACPACGRIHPAHARTSGPHYCSIGCYRAGTGLDDPISGDGRTWCQPCHRYVTPDHRHQPDPTPQGGDR